MYGGIDLADMRSSMLDPYEEETCGKIGEMNKGCDELAALVFWNSTPRRDRINTGDEKPT